MSILRGLQHFFHKIFSARAQEKLSCAYIFGIEYLCRMCPPDLSSLKWGENGELSPNDTLELFERLSRTEQITNSTDKKKLNLSPLKKGHEEITAS